MVLFLLLAVTVYDIRWPRKVYISQDVNAVVNGLRDSTIIRIHFLFAEILAAKLFDVLKLIFDIPLNSC